ncbi:hypothetical protein BS47DRAFT_103591 [Hydnum rufescens UP504]|uniref:Uncharacterized protein n=1 Tax=Hydnum rufescens UP504 TaxID=1448309 RepID=A0A9P6AQD7_9AGAM|nr:hypothetical protein BS47DRAFT_103591 [Hydnum rufescens UP504]
MIHNASVATRNPITDVESLPALWRWMDSSRTIVGVESSRLHGFDFTYQGVLSIWEGFPSFPSKNLPAEDKERGTLHSDQQGTHSNLGATGRTSSGRGHRRPSSRNKSAGDSSRLHYEAEIETINGGRTHGVKKDISSATVQSSKVARRQFALGLFGWDYSDAEFRQAIQRWEENANAERAACWAVLLVNHELAIEILLRSRNEALQMLSGTIKMLVEHPSASERNPWLDHLKRLAVRNTNMYIRTMLSHLVGDGWEDILLQETSIPLRERLAIAFLFLPDDELTKYLHGLVESMKRYGDIEALLITGLNPLALDVIQAYLDNTGDVQTAAILASCVSPARWKPSERSKPFDNHSERWIEGYQNLLDSWRLFHHRCQFDMLRGEIKLAAIHDGEVTPFEWVPRQLEVRCNYCNRIINSSQPTESGPYGINGRVKADFCPSCQRKLPRCVICLMTIGVPDEEARHIELADAISFEDTIDDAMVFCQACRHGGHSGHMLDWFFGDAKGKVHSVCAVADCTCRCAEMI